MTKKATPLLQKPLVQALRTDFLAWYAQAARDLPWRKTKSPYGIWISEIMCQQTQVATVKDYWTRWMAKYPDIEALALAPEDDIMALWAGLGYYRRARLIHKAAKEVVASHDKKLPKDAAGLLGIPGIGRYTAGAIASIAFGEAAPLVDGNVERVFARLFAIEGDPKTSKNQKKFWALAKELVDPKQPGDFNQALMELGATVCTPKSPDCLLCPVRKHCEGFALGNPTKYPAKVKRTKPKPMALATLWLHTTQDDLSYLLVCKRPKEGLWGGLWEAPTAGPQEAKKSWSSEQWDGLLFERLKELGLWSLIQEHGDLLGQSVRHGHFTHVLSHMKMNVQVRSLELDPSVLEAPLGEDVEMKWVSRASLEELGLSKAQKKALKHMDDGPVLL